MEGVRGLSYTSTGETGREQNKRFVMERLVSVRGVLQDAAEWAERMGHPKVAHELLVISDGSDDTYPTSVLDIQRDLAS
jgi:hypothetical protein